MGSVLVDRYGWVQDWTDILDKRDAQHNLPTCFCYYCYYHTIFTMPIVGQHVTGA